MGFKVYFCKECQTSYVRRDRDVDHCLSITCSENPANYAPYKLPQTFKVPAICATCFKDKVSGVPCTNCTNPAQNGHVLVAPGRWATLGQVTATCFCGICDVCIKAIAKETKDAEEKKWQTPAQAKCECGSEIASGANARHSAWCPKFSAVE